MGLGRAGLYFWYELPGRLLLLSKRFRIMGSPGSKKVSQWPVPSLVRLTSHTDFAIAKSVIRFHWTTFARATNVAFIWREIQFGCY